ncbi:hypothetical protein ACS0TY_008846 [Phlomoides rotata]
MTQSEIDFQNGAEKMAWSEEHERVPLKQRLKLLLASSRISADSCLESEKANGNVVSSSPQEPSVIQNSIEAKVECAAIDVESSSANCSNASSLAGIQAVKSEPEMSDEFLDELDHVVLKERLRRLLQSKCLGLSSSLLEESSPEAVKGELSCGDQRQAVSCNQVHGIDRTFKSGTSYAAENPFSKPTQALNKCSQGNSSFSSDSLRSQRNETDRGKTLLSDDIRSVKISAIPKLANVKTEPPSYDEFQNSNENTLGQMSFGNFVLVKNEVQNADDACDDELDHMLLRERMKLLSSRNCPSLDIHQSSKCASEVPPAPACRPVESKPAQLLKINRPRKRRKTVTDSIETAMEEDAPGLLQVLVEKGVSVDEIKLYGEPESNDALDDSSIKDSFSDLEQVITKVFSQRESLLKSGILRCMKEERASYCLECLFALVEQARYLQFRNWPVEWGWCRDLQSFIFVFERHNRIVLERPEYGYATYFFELEDSLPIAWQIKRLVISMKLTNCSRITLIENKALMVGDDLTEGEARVLTEYGWIPNTGLGTMLNYHERVIHDRRNDKDRSEWRLKIGKLLTDGYNGGTLIPTAIPIKVTEYNAEHPPEVKLELD